MKKKYTKKEHRLIETQLTDYFKDLEKNADVKNKYPLDGDFEADKVYAGVLTNIRSKNRKATFSLVSKIAASIFLVFSIGLLAYNYHYTGMNINSEQAFTEQSAPIGKVITLKLSDGTVVVLNSGSKLLYPDTFNSKIRRVILQGEGYFKVAHEKLRPFIVETDKINTQVLGTSFNINAYEESDDISVTVVTGKVGVYSRNSDSSEKTQFLTANQQVVFNKANGVLNKPQLRVNTAELTAWTRGRIVYDNIPLVDVISDLEKHYEVKIEIPTQIKHCRITANFENESLDKVLKVLAQLIDGKLEVKNGIHHLNGKGC